MSHSQWAANARLQLSQEVLHGSARPMTVNRLCPGRGMYPQTHAKPHELMIGGMEFDFVDAMAESIKTFQHRWILVGLEAPINPFVVTDCCAQFQQSPAEQGAKVGR